MWWHCLTERADSEHCFQRLCEAHGLSLPHADATYQQAFAASVYTRVSEMNYINTNTDCCSSIDWAAPLLFVASPRRAPLLPVWQAQNINAHGGNVNENLYARLCSPPDDLGGGASHDDLPGED